VLQDCLESLRRCPDYRSWEVILADNASTDGTADFVSRDFPEIHVIRNDRNVGFTRATNQGFRVSRGRYLLWLNPDTRVFPDSIPRLIELLQQKPRAGIVGPKVVNPDGSFQEQCRRGLPTPAASFFHVLGFDRLWPTSRTFGGYLLTYMPVGETMPVVSVSGCCLLARREVWNDIGPLDEQMFGFGEDIDWCMRAAAAGWEVWYQPASIIVHLKGHGGAHAHPFRKIRGMHECMWLIYRRHFSRRYRWPMTALVASGISASFLFSVFVRSVRQAVKRLRVSSPRQLSP
jgi:hypothetical protein